MSENKNKKRNKVLATAALFFVATGAATGVYEYVIGIYHETTDNAYVQGDIYTVTPQTAGIVRDVYVHETQNVKKGELLALLDDRDAALTLEKAKESLALTVRQIVRANRDVEEASAGAEIAKRDLTQAEADLARRKDLVKTGALSSEEYQHTLERVQQARDTLTMRLKRQESLATAVRGKTLEENPSVRLAVNTLEEALLAYKRCRIVAPCDGIIAKKNIQSGRKVNAGETIMAVVAHTQLWVDANFKETQMSNLRIGQPVHLVSDLYGDKEPFHGRIVGISPGTGSSFTLLPAQNASGNWIKIVQRIPVRIALDPKQFKTRPLRVGLSMEADVDTHERSGSMLSSPDMETKATEDAMYHETTNEAHGMAALIIAANR